MPKVSIDTSLNTVQVVKSGNDLQKTMDKLGRSIEKTFDGRKASGLGDALKPLTQELAKIMTQAGDTAAQIKALEKADRIYLSAADAAQLALIQNVYKDKDCYGLIDVVKDCGPLGGLYTVLQQLKDEDEWIFVTACDVPE